MDTHTCQDCGRVKPINAWCVCPPATTRREADEQRLAELYATPIITDHGRGYYAATREAVDNLRRWWATHQPPRDTIFPHLTYRKRPQP